MTSTTGCLGALAIAVGILLAPSATRAEDQPRAAATRSPRLIDLGARVGFARPVGAFDAGTRATDVSYGGVPFALDATYRLTGAGAGASAWSVAAGAFVSYGPMSPTLCTSTSECISSIGHDTELIALARVRGPRFRFILPEAEIGMGWSWSTRALVDRDATSTRRWNGPVLLRAAIVPSFVLGTYTRFGIVLGGSVARSTSFTLEAPGVERHGIDGGRLHGTLDLGVRLGVDFGG